MQFSLEMEFIPNILIVDDEPANLILMEEALKPLGKVEVCDSPLTALEKARNKEFHIIILDIEMPEINGIELCKQLKDNPLTHSSAVIFVTSHNDPDMEYQALINGGLDFLSKPIDFRLCQTRIKNHILTKQYEHNIKGAEKDIQSLIKQVPVFITLWNTNLECLFSNDFDGNWFGIKASETVGKEAKSVIPISLLNKLEKKIIDSTEDNNFIISIDGVGAELKHLQVTFTERSYNEVVRGYLLTISDITSIKKAELDLALERERLHVTLNSIGDAVIATDLNQRITFMNPIAERMTGWAIHDAKGENIDEVMQLSDSSTGMAHFNPITIALQEKRVVAMALNAQLTSRNGQVFRVEDSAAPIKDTNNNVIGAIIVFHDISEAVAMSVKMSHLANYDQLTNLPNRILLHDRISQAYRTAIETEHLIALFLIDIDNFKYLNDNLGHHVGDTIILKFARRLESLIDTDATISRIGGDEFVLLLPSVTSSGKADLIASNIVNTLNKPFIVNENDYSLTVSIGISLGPTEANSPEQLLMQADAAMFRAKDNGKNQYCFYSNDIEKELSDRHEIERIIKNSIENDLVEVFYQPKFNLKDRKIVGVEALVRLRDDNGNLLSPAKFIPLAEENGQIVDLGNYVFKRSCLDAKEWVNRGVPMKVAINVAAKQLSNSAFFDFVSNTIEEIGLLTRYIELEVTESALINDYQKTKKLLNDLSTLGLSIAIDDFGTGYSSLSYLKMFPVDVLKIDQSFVQDMLNDAQSLDIVRAIIHLAKSLNLTLVGEGIEELEQHEKLIEFGCQLGQGYLFSKPLPKEEFDCFLNEKLLTRNDC